MLVLSAKLCIFTNFHGKSKVFFNMKEKVSALFSQYVIDGIRCDATPYELLSESMEFHSDEGFPTEEYAPIVDETIDPPVTSFRYDSSRCCEYMKEAASMNEERAFRMLYPETFTKMKVACALIDRIWSKGHFKLGNLNILAEWEWNTRPIGNMAAFYRSVQAASEYIYDLGCRIEDFSVAESDEKSRAAFAAVLREVEQDEDVIKSSPYESSHPWMETGRNCPDTLTACDDSHVIYIPFDTAAFKLGGSLLAEMNGHNGGPAPHIMDPDYFIDCYEVVRELVEDGIVMSGITVGDGGLGRAISLMCSGFGLSVNLSGISSSYMENDCTKIMFSEIPGVLIQVSGSNMDYLDSQLLLQDVAYYSLGSPEGQRNGIRIEDNQKAAVAGILSSLMNQASEGED